MQIHLPPPREFTLTEPCPVLQGESRHLPWISLDLNRTFQVSYHRNTPKMSSISFDANFLTTEFSAGTYSYQLLEGRSPCTSGSRQRERSPLAQPPLSNILPARCLPAQPTSCILPVEASPQVNPCQPLPLPTHTQATDATGRCKGAGWEEAATRNNGQAPWPDSFLLLVSKWKQSRTCRNSK